MDPIKLPFDQYQRYQIITDAIKAVREGPRPLKILDVGGSPGLVIDFLPEDDIYILDEVNSPRGRFICGDGTALPFRDEAFDIVICVDVLEHIAPPLRGAFIRELKRVSKDSVFIAAPFKTKAVEEAERILYDVIKSASGEEHAFLREHIEFGLPEKSAILKELTDGVWQALDVPNGALKRWLPMMALSIYVTGDKFLNELAERINDFYNSNYYTQDNMEPSYRYLLASARRGFTTEAIKKIKGLSAEAGREKDLDLSWLSPLITLFGYNRLKKAQETEVAEFRKVIEARDKFIQSLKDTVEKKDGRIERQRERIEGLTKRLDSLEKSISVKALKRLGLTKKTVIKDKT